MVRILIARAAIGGAVVLTLTAASPAQAADAQRGRATFQAECSVCHSGERGGGVILGPPLYGVVGRRAGSVPGFAYSPAMRAAGFVWGPDRLRAYLPSPRGYLPGVRMTYPGLKDPARLEDLIAYLQTLGAAPLQTAGAGDPARGRD